MAEQKQTSPKGSKGGIGRSLFRLFLSGHVALYRRTNGKIGGGEHLLLLTTTGRKSKAAWTTPLFFFRDGQQIIVIASAGGSEKDPAWWLNLKSTPQATIQINSQIIPVVAHKADGAERQRLWAIIAQQYKQFVAYQDRTTREIPVVILQPV